MLLRTESYKSGIYISTILNIFGKGFVFLNALLIAYLFGTNAQTDVYFFTLTTVNVICGFINGIDLLVLIPESMRIRQREGLKGEMHYLNFFIRLYACLGLVFVVLISLAPVMFYDIFSNFRKGELSGNVLILSLSAAIIPLQLVTNLIVSILASHKYFSVPIFVSIVNNVLCIVFLLVFRNSLHIAAGILAIVSGFIINLILLIYILRKKLHWSFSGLVSFPSARNWKDIVLMELNFLPLTLKSTVVYFLISGLGAGVLSTLNYSSQIVMIPEMLILQQIAAVAGIKITELSARNDKAELNVLFLKTMNFLMFILIPVSAFIFLFSEEISEVLYLRGNMTRVAVAQVSVVVSLLILILPVKAYADFFVTRIITAQQKLKDVVWVTIAMHITVIFIIYFAIKYYQFYGYLVALIFSYWVVSTLVFYVLLKKIAPFIRQEKFFKHAGMLILINIPICIFLFFTRLYAGSYINNYALLIISMGIYFGFLLMINKRFKLDESIEELTKKIFTIIKRRIGIVSKHPHKPL
ncbi:MAG: lipid II flippase MurJ [Ferruginibacter sp.]